MSQLKSIFFRILGLFFLFTATGEYSYAGDLYNSVTEFGAKGDGRTDDTEAIQRAIEASNRMVNSNNNIPGVYSGPIYFGNWKTVYFPAGMYKISKPINLSSYAYIKGDKAVIFPDTKYKTGSIGFLCTNTWQSKFDGIQFLSFDRALDISNNNIECGRAEITNCDFLSNKIAIKFNAVSTFLLINGNRFSNNQKTAIINAAQKTDMSDNWITAGTLTGKQDAQIISNTVLHFDKNILVPVPPANGAIEPAWINNYNSVIINGTRQGGEPGSFTLVNNFAKAAQNPFWPNTVIIRDCECYAVYGNEKNYIQPGALRLIEIPNNIVLENLVGFIDSKLMDFTRVKKPTLSSDKNALSNNAFIHKIRVNNIQGVHTTFPNGTLIPDGLEKYRSE